MKIAIIGANGQLGSDLMKVLGDAAIPFTHSEIDVADPNSLNILEKIRPSVIINCAAYVRVDDAEREAEKAFRVNAIGALNVAKISRKLDAINVYISTDYVFDGTKNSPYIEEELPNPINVYGLSKYAGEVATRNYSSKYYIIRLSSLFGVAGARGKGGNFVETIIKKAKKGEELRVVNDIVMSPTHTLDAARGIKRLLEIVPEYGIYHMSNEGMCTWYDFAKEILRLSGLSDVKISPIKSEELNLPAKRPKFSALSIEKVKRVGIEIKSWKEALREYMLLKGHLRRDIRCLMLR